MKTVSAALSTHLAQTLTTIATCWRILRLDGEIFRFTDHDVNVVIEDETYEASSGFLPSAMSQNRSLAPANMEAVAFLSSTKIVEADLVAGLFDYALVDVFQVNYEDVSMGVLWLARGFRLGEVEIRDNSAKVEIRGKAQNLAQNFIEVYTPGCRAVFGDARCTVDIEGLNYFHDGAVTTATSRREFIDTSIAQSNDVFRFGKLTWLTGLNTGFSMEVKKYDPGTDTVFLFLSMPYVIQVGDTYHMQFGCTHDLSPTTGCKFYDNVVNFRGEPYVPGPDRVLNVAIPPEA